jgi:hypothetical protein
MKIFDRYTIEELRRGLGDRDSLLSRSNYNKFHSAYEYGIRNDKNFYSWVKGIEGNSKRVFIDYALDRELMVIHILELPLEKVPLYINSKVPEVKKACQFRMEHGR